MCMCLHCCLFNSGGNGRAKPCLVQRSFDTDVESSSNEQPHLSTGTSSHQKPTPAFKGSRQRRDRSVSPSQVQEKKGHQHHDQSSSTPSHDSPEHHGGLDSSLVPRFEVVALEEAAATVAVPLRPTAFHQVVPPPPQQQQSAPQQDRVVIVVEGARFVVDRALFRAMPNTMLGRMFRYMFMLLKLAGIFCCFCRSSLKNTFSFY